MGQLGDVFEMEDQRNWTDASYKTYSRPLSLPFPHLIDAETGVDQRLEVVVRGTPALPVVEDDVLVLTDVPSRFPQVAVGAATDPGPAPRLAPLGDAVLVELDLATGNWDVALARAASAGRPLDVRMIAGPDHDLGRVAKPVRVPHRQVLNACRVM